jgi:hypothetical protein
LGGNNNAHSPRWGGEAYPEGILEGESPLRVGRAGTERRPPTEWDGGAKLYRETYKGYHPYRVGFGRDNNTYANKGGGLGGIKNER